MELFEDYGHMKNIARNLMRRKAYNRWALGHFIDLFFR